MPTVAQSKPLSIALLADQLATIDLLLGMFYNEGELTVSDPTALASLREHVESPIPTSPAMAGADSLLLLPQAIDLELNVQVAPDRLLELHIRVPLTGRHDEKGGIGTGTGARTHDDDDDDAVGDADEEAPQPSYVLRCPSWLTRKAHAELVANMPVNDPDGVLGVVQYLQETCSASALAKQSASASCTGNLDTYTNMNTTDDDDNNNNNTTTRALVRVWFYLQSLSTRSKRLDLVNWAPSYSLTGFVLAGKPGILCLEGTSADISSYMAEIKTRSWSDVPAYQKKVTERCREEGEDGEGVKRAFDGFREVTDEIGKGGKRGNRGEMGEVRELFRRVGLEGMFEVVVGFGGGGGGGGGHGGTE